MADSLGKRYLFKLASNAATIPLFFILEAVLPRALGPAVYGNFNFVTTLFQNFTNFLDMGTSTCLFTILSQRPGERGPFVFYARAALIMLILCLAAAGLACLPGVGTWLMPGVPLWMAVPAAIWAYLVWAGRVARGMNDALGITTRSEIARIVCNLLAAAALLGLYFGGLLSLPVLFWHQYAAYGLLAAGFLWTLRGSVPPPGAPMFPPPLKKNAADAEDADAKASWAGTESRPDEPGEPDEPGTAGSAKETGTPGTAPPPAPLPALSMPPGSMRAYAREFADYSLPLFVIALFSALALSAERWLLQSFDGSVQQGYFSLSQKVGMACFLFVTALTPLLMRELAVAYARKDRQEMGRLLNRLAPMIYAVAAWLSCFTLVEAPAVVHIFGGAAFAGALAPVRIMALFPMHQGYGQVAGAVFYATGATRLLRNLTIFSLTGGLAVSWLLLAPAGMFGLGLGATGLAIKMVAVQFVTVNVCLAACRRLVPFDFWRNVLHQIVCPLALLGLALAGQRLSEAAAAAFFGAMEGAAGGMEAGADGRMAEIVRFLLSGLCYCLLTLGAALTAPFVFGLRAGELRGLPRRMKAGMRG